MRLSLIIFVATFLNNVNAGNFLETITFGHVNVGDNRIQLSEKNFTIDSEFIENEKIEYEVTFVKNTFEWVRTNDVLLTPRARVLFKIDLPAARTHITYKNQSLALQRKNDRAQTQMYISLFDNSPIEIFHNHQKIGEVKIKVKKSKTKDGGLLIDYSCSRSNIQVDNIDGEYFVLGCRKHRVGDFGNEKQMLELLWFSPHLKLDKNTPPPYMSIFFDSTPVELELLDQKGNLKKIKISAKLPKRMHRLRTAYGYGPYAFNSAFEKTERNDDIAPAIMLYFNYNLDKNNSIRGFEAAVFKDAIFNNAGIYYANDIAKILDNRLIITTLIGFQALYFKFNDDSPTKNGFIFPQGIELLYKHAFGIENYIVSYGMFLDPSESYDYQNLWIRWGKNYFWEINFIGWQENETMAKMWGLSVGFPFKGFF
ncbi:hypothetical protein N9N67_09175 [Bacteriovoracaceae bacterium]|nr:hypothetical protein [Bacteriovoracaceae bacterium]